MASPGTIAKYPETTVGDVLLDAVTSESHSFDVDVTEHPVETGSAISDHARPRPNRLTLDAVISNTPLTAAAQSNSDSTQGDDSVGRAQAAMRRFEEMRDTSELLMVVTPARIYANMVIESMTVPRDPSTGDALRFSLSFKQVRVVANKAVVVEPQVTRAKKKQNLGNQNPPKTSDTTKDKVTTDTRRRSTLKAFSDDGLSGVSDRVSQLFQ